MSNLEAQLAYRHHDHQHCIADALAAARQLAARKGVRLTRQRELVLRLIWQNHKPVGAYQLMEQLAALSGPGVFAGTPPYPPVKQPQRLYRLRLSRHWPRRSICHLSPVWRRAGAQRSQCARAHSGPGGIGGLSHRAANPGVVGFVPQLPHPKGVPVSRLIEATDLSLVLGERTILQSVQLGLQAGKITTLIGPNGAGKTSLVRLLLGLQRPTGGSLWRRPDLRIGYMPQKLHIEPSLPLTARRFLQLGGASPAQLAEALALTGIEHLLASPMQALSGGEVQRVLLTRALARQPQLLVLDEPVQGVDVNGQVALYNLIDTIRRTQGCGVLMVSHDLHLVMAHTDEVICLNQHVCCHGHPESVTSHPAYLALFGAKAAQTLAVYTHHHDHKHNLHGDVVCDHDHRPAATTAGHGHKDGTHA
jgi:zinc transport system ATP-binding protein